MERPAAGSDPETWWERYGHRVGPNGDGPAPEAAARAEDVGRTMEHEPGEVGATSGRRTGGGTARAVRRDGPVSGWRRALLRVSGGPGNSGPVAAERRQRELLHRIRRPLSQARHIAVVSMKGGVGKTTVATLLGLVLADNRGDRVIVVDANPDAGTLADRLTGGAAVTVREFLRDLGHPDSWAAVARSTSHVGRLQVLGSEQDPGPAGGLDRAEYEQVCALLERYFNIIITDSGTGFLHPATAGTLARADSLVIVGAPTVDGAGRASKSLDWLWKNGYGALAADAVAVLSASRSSSEVNTDLIRTHFAERCRAVVDVPHDPRLATGGRVELAHLQPATRAAAFELAALLADDFPA